MVGLKKNWMLNVFLSSYFNKYALMRKKFLFGITAYAKMKNKIIPYLQVL